MTEGFCSEAVYDDDASCRLEGETLEMVSPSQFRPSREVVLEDEPQSRRK